MDSAGVCDGATYDHGGGGEMRVEGRRSKVNCSTFDL